MKACRLERAACPGDACPFWEKTGCVLDRVPLSFEANLELADYLLLVRAELEAARPAEEGR